MGNPLARTTNRIYTCINAMEFEWDAVKNRANIKKHGIDLNTAVLVFADPHLVLERQLMAKKHPHHLSQKS